jgi:hypothetical protein
MTGFGVEDFFLLRTGKACPVGTLTDDSNVIGFGESQGVISIAAELDRDQAAQVRAFGNDVTKTSCRITISGEPLAFYLVGKRITDRIWRGIASVDPIFVPNVSMVSSWEERAASNVVKFPVRRAG